MVVRSGTEKHELENSTTKISDLLIIVNGTAEDSVLTKLSSFIGANIIFYVCIRQ